MTKKTSALKYYYDNLNFLNFTRWELSRLAMHHRKMKKEKYPIMCSNYAIHLENSSICEVNICEAFELTFKRRVFPLCNLLFGIEDSLQAKKQNISQFQKV